jgi:adenylate cyclase
VSTDSPGRLGRFLQRLDKDPRLVKLLRLGRSRLPGDDRYGDPLSLTGDQAPAVLGRRLSALTAEQPGALREVGMSALQVWQGVSEAQGRGRGDRELTIVFTDLAGFSTWALDAGDTQAVALLREVGSAIEPELCARGGEIVKRLGDGLMVVFEDPGRAIEAAHAAARALEGVEIDGHCPQLRAGVHAGRPRRLGGDYFGVDVNIAARVAEAAGPGEVLVSEAVHERVHADGVQLKRRWRFAAKGAPKGLKVYAAEPS